MKITISLLLLNFVLVAKPDLVGLDKGGAVRVSLLMAGVWWAAFTIIPVRGLRNVTGTVAPPVAPGEGVVGGSLRQLRETFRDLALHYPQTKLFLLAYLFFNDGIQTVIGNSSLYGIEELEFPQETVLGIFLFVQFVAFFGARFFGQVAARIGAWKTVLSVMPAAAIRKCEQIIRRAMQPSAVSALSAEESNGIISRFGTARNSSAPTAIITSAYTRHTRTHS